MHTSALLHYVRGLVRGGVQIGHTGECDMIPGGVRFGPDLGARTRSSFAGVRLDLAHVVRAERGLDDVEMRQRRSAVGDAALRCLVDVVAGGGSGGLALHRYGVCVQRLSPEVRPHARLARRIRRRAAAARLHDSRIDGRGRFCTVTPHLDRPAAGGQRTTLRRSLRGRFGRGLSLGGLLRGG